MRLRRWLGELAELAGELVAVIALYVIMFPVIVALSRKPRARRKEATPDVYEVGWLEFN